MLLASLWAIVLIVLMTHPLSELHSMTLCCMADSESNPNAIKRQTRSTRQQIPVPQLLSAGLERTGLPTFDKSHQPKGKGGGFTASLNQPGCTGADWI